MNYMSSAAYPLQQSSELLHQISSSSNPLQQQTIINHQDNIIQIHPFSNLEDNNYLPIFKLDHNKYKLVAAAACCNSSGTTTTTTPNKDHHHRHNDSSRVDHDQNKKNRRDVERQRRQEMANLYGLLRSLLPLEYIKGKRSISDHMNEAANYIKHLQKKIQVMKDKRDGLKRLSSINYCNPRPPSVIARGISCSFPHDHHQPDFVRVLQCSDGLEVVISSSLMSTTTTTTTADHDGYLTLLPLSRVLQALVLEDGLTVIRCVSTRVNQTSVLHTIQSEVSNNVRGGINTLELQQKLMDLLIQYSSTRNPMLAGTTSYSVRALL